MYDKYLIKRCNLKRKSKPYVSFSPSLWGDNVFLSKRACDVRLTYSGDVYALPDLLVFEDMYSVKCKLVKIDKDTGEEIDCPHLYQI